MRKRHWLTGIIIILLAVAVVLLIHGKAEAPKKPAHAVQPVTSAANHANTSGASFDKSKYSVTDPTSPWVIVNKQHPLDPAPYAPTDLTSVGDGQYMRAEAAQALKTMLSAAQSAGFSVTAASGYRSYDTQVTTYASEVKAYGQTVADSESARPGYSEHQTGWAVDLASDGCSITDCFGTTPGGQWVTANAYKYGFILRYTPGNTAITGYRAEAWHFRYIGTSLASELHKDGITTLEQFFHVTGGPTYK